jgi:signal transduction histidine kinase
MTVDLPNASVYEGARSGYRRSRPAPPSWSEVLPILLLIGVVQASLLLPGSLAHPVDFYVSTGLLLSLPVLFWNRYPRSILVPALIYIASACCLNLASAGNNELNLLFFLPIVGVTLLGSRAQAGITIGAVVAGSIVVSIVGGASITATARRSALTFGIGLVIAIAIISLREPLVRSRQRARLLLKDAQAVNDMARRFAVLTEPASIKRMAAELAATVGSPPESSWRRGAFLGIDGEQATVDSQFDQFDNSASPIDVAWPSRNDRLVEEAMRSRSVVSGLVTESVEAGADRESPHGSTYATWVPIVPNGRFEGLLGVASQRKPVPDTSVEQLVSLGHLVELALSNWRAHEQLEEMTTRKDRRKIARELHDGLAQELAFIATKTTSPALVARSPEVMRQLSDAADRALDEARRAIVILSEHHESLSVSIGQTVEDLATRYAMTAKVDVSRDVELGGEAAENLLRIIREAIANAARHGNASVVTVRLVRADDVVHLLVADNGHGFELDGKRRETVGYGLTFMKERCASIGATLDIRSRQDFGTTVEVRMPA